MSGYLPCRQSDRVCGFDLIMCSFWGRLMRGSRAGESRLKTASWPARGFKGVCFELVAVLKHTPSSRLFREQGVRLAHGEPSSASSSRLWRWTWTRVTKESTAATAPAAVSPKVDRWHALLPPDDGTRCWRAENRMCHAESL